MIKANELRIGNIVLFNPDEKVKRFCVVKDICSKSIVILDKGLDLQLFEIEFLGVPLSHEMFQMFGFDKIKRGRLIVYKISKPNFTLQLIYDEFNGEILLDSPHFNFVYAYVHQIQNLYFALTGEELTAKELTGTIKQ